MSSVKDVPFPNNIRKIRKILDIDLITLSKVLGCSIQTMYSLDSGRAKIREIYAIKLSKYFSCDQRFLTGEFNNLDFIQNNNTNNKTATQNTININNSYNYEISKDNYLEVYCYNDYISFKENKFIKEKISLSFFASFFKQKIENDIIYLKNKSLFLTKTDHIELNNNLSKYLILYKSQDIVANIKHLILTDQYELEMDDNKITLSSEDFKNNCEVIGKVVAEVISC